MALDDLAPDEKTLVLRYLNIMWHAAVACVSTEWRRVACDKQAPWGRLQRGETADLADVVYATRAASRDALDRMWASARVISLRSVDPSERGQPGIHSTLASQVQLLACGMGYGRPSQVVVTPCAAVALGEACEWAVSWYHTLFDAWGVPPGGRTPARLWEIFDLSYAARKSRVQHPRSGDWHLASLNGHVATGLFPPQILGSLSRVDTLDMAALDKMVPHLPEFEHLPAFESICFSHDLRQEGPVTGNWLLAICFLNQFLPALLDNCKRTEHWLRWLGELRRLSADEFLFVSGDAVLKTLQCIPTTTLRMAKGVHDCFGWSQFAAYSSNSIHAHLARMQPTLLCLAQKQLTPFLDEVDLPASNESESSAPTANGTRYWAIVGAYMSQLKAGVWLSEEDEVGCELDAESCMSSRSGVLDTSQALSELTDDISEEDADDMYQGFLRDCCREEDEEGEDGGEEGEDGGEEDEDEDEDEDDNEEEEDDDDDEYDPDDPPTVFEVFESSDRAD